MIEWISTHITCCSQHVHLPHAYAGYFWLTLALMFLIFEVGTPGLFFFVSFAIAAGCTAIFAFLGTHFYGQCVISIVTGCIAFISLKKYAAQIERSSFKSNIEALVGQKAMVIQIIEPHKSGLVKIKGDVWPAIVEESLTLHKNTLVTIVGVEGNKLVVK